MKSVFLPILMLAVGATSLFFDRKDPKLRWLLWTLGGLLILTCVVQIYTNGSERAAKDAEISWNRKHIMQLTELLSVFRSEAGQQFEDMRTLLLGFGWGADRVPESTIVEQSLQADEQRSKLAAHSDVAPRGAVTVQYFPKDVDGPVVEGALADLGFRVVRGRSLVEHAPTNAIWFGSKIRIEDVKLVALTLIRAGVEIKIIRPFRDQGRKRELIQVGADSVYLSAPVISVTDIAEAAEFVR